MSLPPICPIFVANEYINYLENYEELFYYLGVNNNPLAVYISDTLCKCPEMREKMVQYMCLNKYAGYLWDATKDNTKCALFFLSMNSSDKSARQLLNILEKGEDIRTINFLLGYMSANENSLILDYLERYPEKIQWDLLSQNSSQKAVKLLMDNPEKISVNGICINKHPLAVKYVIEEIIPNYGMMPWSLFCMNSNPIATKYMLEHREKIVWQTFCMNSNPEATKYMLDHSDKISWKFFCRNTNRCAVEYIQKMTDIVYIFDKAKAVAELYQNENALHILFDLDYEKMKKKNEKFVEELVAKVFHPSRMIALSEKYKMDLAELISIY